MERVSAGAGVGRAALHRRHKSVAELALAALLKVGTERVVMPVSSDLSADLQAYLRVVVTSLDRRGDVGKAFRMLLARAQTDDAMAASFHDFLVERREPVRRRLEASNAEFSHANSEQVIDQLFGPLLYRLLIRNVDVGEAEIASCIASAMCRRHKT